MIEIIGEIFTLVELAKLVIAAIIGAGILFSLVRYVYRKEIRLFKNARRPIIFFKSGENNMDVEIELLKRVGFFTVEEKAVSNHQMTDLITNHGLIVLGYSSKMSDEDFREIVNAAKQKKIPLIVYGRLTDTTRDELKRYQFYSMCESPLRLVNDVFGILSTFNHTE